MAAAQAAAAEAAAARALSDGDGWDSEATELREQLTAVQEEVAAATERAATAESQLEDAMAALRAMEVQKVGLEEVVKELRRAADGVQAQGSSAVVEVEELRSRVAELETQVLMRDSEVARLSAQVRIDGCGKRGLQWSLVRG